MRKKVCYVACGWSHTAAITGTLISNTRYTISLFNLSIEGKGVLYTWGMGRYGRLGHGDEFDQYEPCPVLALLGLKVKNVSLGERHSVCVTGALIFCQML
jgi:alpha-tubulin suppressor-like RCC1 family protein